MTGSFEEWVAELEHEQTRHERSLARINAKYRVKDRPSSWFPDEPADDDVRLEDILLSKGGER